MKAQRCDAQGRRMKKNISKLEDLGIYHGRSALQETAFAMAFVITLSQSLLLNAQCVITRVGDRKNLTSYRVFY